MVKGRKRRFIRWHGHTTRRQYFIFSYPWGTDITLGLSRGRIGRGAKYK
jgi:hypothetical protein